MDRSKELINLMAKFGESHHDSPDAPVSGLFLDLAYTMYNRDTVVDQSYLEDAINKLLSARQSFFLSLEPARADSVQLDDKE